MSSFKEVHTYEEKRGSYLSALDKIAKPIARTLTPKGRNVLFQDEHGQVFVTNDGATIAKNIWVEDDVENVVISLVKQSALRTNAQAGDGTSTTIILADALIRGGMKLVDAGMNPMDLSRSLQKASDILVKEIESRKIEVKGDKDLEYIARISANNDTEIAKNVVEVIDHAGTDGMIFLEDSSKDEVTIEKESGFMLEAGYFAPQFVNQPQRGTTRYNDVLVFITDKKLYHEDEVMAILNAAHDMGELKVVIVAADFIGQAPNILIANHLDPKVDFEILAVKQEDGQVLNDLATYLGGRVFSEKRGSLVSQLSEGDFVRVAKVHSDSQRTIILADEDRKDSKALKDLIALVKGDIEKADKDSAEEKQGQKRLGSLTNGVVTIKVGGKAPAEIRERLYRYEDSINASRNALKFGYLPGGGVTLKSVFEKVKESIPAEIRELVASYCEAPIRQIAENCGILFKEAVGKYTDKIGYNAVTEKFEDLLKAGVIEPVQVLKMAVENSFSVSQILLSVEHLIIHKEKEKDGRK